MAHDARSAWRGATLLLLLLVLFSVSGVFDHSLWAPIDSHEGGMLAETYRSGHWIALSYYREPFLEKPPLMHWTALILCTIFGRIGAGLIRVPSALFGLATLIIVWLWGRRLGRERAGVLAAFLCATSFTYCEYSRVVLTDICLTFVVVISLHAFWSAYDAQGTKLWRYALFLLATSFSFYAKGLVGPLFIMASVVVFLATARRWTQAAVLSLAFAPLIVAAVFPWAAALYREGGREYLIRALVDNQLGRFFRLPEGAAITSLPFAGRLLGFMAARPIPFDPYFVHKEAIDYYLVKLPTRLLPWTFLIPAALVFWFRRGSSIRSPFASFLRCAFAVIVVILHLSSAKAGVYALPLYPILFLMAGVWCEDLGATSPSWLDAMTVSLTSGLVGAVMIVVPSLYLIVFALPRTVSMGLVPVLRRFGATERMADPSTLIWAAGPAAAWWGAGLCLVALIVACWLLRRVSALFAAKDYGGGALGLAAAFAIVVMLVGTAVMPAVDHQRTFRPIVELVKTELDRGRQIAVANRDSQIVGEFVFYAGQLLPLIEPVPGTRAFLEQGPEARGVVVLVDQLPSVENSLQGVDHAVRTVAASAGLNATRLCLITREAHGP